MASGSKIGLQIYTLTKPPIPLSIYEPLDIEIYEIRILTILPGQPGSVVECTLRKTSLIDSVKYVALSYCWGDESITTEILVNNIVTSVTSNLADALEHMRDQNITRIWADALCINQADRQEKSLQIRNMGQVFSAAEKCFAWIGNEGHDNAHAAMSFLQKLSQPESVRQLEGVLHSLPVSNSILSMQAISDTPSNAPRKETGYQPHSLEFHFHALVDLFRRPYWKRRWVIQEIIVATRVQVVCGSVAIDLQALNDTIKLCQNSSYWQLEAEAESYHFRNILDLRHSYHTSKKPSLCRAIAITNGSISSDPRDKVFALLGLCHDGAELVPMPNYRQTVEVIVRDISRSIIMKSKCLDLILINGVTNEIPTGPLPSWAPNWLSPDLPKHAHTLAEKDTRAGDPVIHKSLLGDGNALHVQGVIVGTIVNVASHLELLGQHPLQATPSRPSVPRYYYNNFDFLPALLLISADGFSYVGGLKRFKRYLLHWTYIYNKIRYEEMSPACWDNVMRQNLDEWVEVNAIIPIPIRNLRDWLLGERFSGCLVRAISFFGSFGSIFASKVPWGILFSGALIGYAEESGWRVPRIFGPQVRTIVFSLALVLSFMTVTRGNIQEVEGQMLSGFENIVKHSKRLILSDKGFIGVACRGARTGDKICFLTGCTKPVILRSTSGGDALEYQVVGEAFIYLSNGDQWRYRRFLDSSWRTEGDDSVTMKVDKELDRAALETRARDSSKTYDLEIGIC
ncbi:heterokaryon incompatibility protein-domain-containing protein [Hyaloscypha sp. PMI_1271]|nr:heterokaryon incompatibility protein-domain-containing protein [Hyaloscypha sp. PMI_1271]